MSKYANRLAEFASVEHSQEDNRVMICRTYEQVGELIDKVLELEHNTQAKRKVPGLKQLVELAKSLEQEAQ